MINKTLVATAVAVGIAMSGNVIADGFHGWKFKGLTESADSADWDPAAPWKLHKGFKQKVVSDETDLNIYDGGRDDWHDMNTVNETGPMAGSYRCG